MYRKGWPILLLWLAGCSDPSGPVEGEGEVIHTGFEGDESSLSLHSLDPAWESKRYDLSGFRNINVSFDAESQFEGTSTFSVFLFADFTGDPFETAETPRPVSSLKKSFSRTIDTSEIKFLDKTIGFAFKVHFGAVTFSNFVVKGWRK